MLKKQTQALISVIFICFLFMLSGCNGQNLANENRCLIDSSKCLSFSDKNVKIRFLTDVLLAEQLTPITLESTKVINKVWLEGLNMNMGQVPILVSKSDNGYSGNLFLGLCSEPIMKWELNITFADHTHSRFVVTSHWKR